jgi:hypothetical protein
MNNQDDKTDKSIIYDKINSPVKQGGEPAAETEETLEDLPAQARAEVSEGA